jgi:hypothetical protein
LDEKTGHDNVLAELHAVETAAALNATTYQYASD